MMLAPVTVGVMMMVAVASTAGQAYPSTWDNINMDKLLSNDRLVKAYANCLMDRGTCTVDGAALKRFLPEALKTGCSKCSKKQKDQGLKVIKFMIEKKPDLWKDISSKYDPDGTYTKKYSQNT